MGKGPKEKMDTSSWYELWIKQSKTFFDSASANLEEVFTKNVYAEPQAHLKQINEWLSDLKTRWQKTQHLGEENQFEAYWVLMAKMYNEASEMMLKEWVHRTNRSDPIQNIHELYELWLRCCHDVYQKTLLTQTYQDAYSNMMNAAMKFWHAALNK